MNSKTNSDRKGRNRTALALLSALPLVIATVGMTAKTAHADPAPKLQKAKKETVKREARFESIDGGSLSVSQFEGRVVVLILCGKDSAPPGMTLMREVTLGSAPEKEVAYVLVADLRDAPGLFRGAVRGKVKGELKNQREKTVEAFKKAGVAYEPRHVATVLIDWKGDMAKQFAIRDNLDSLYQVIVLDRKGQVVSQIAQPDPKKDNKSLAPSVLKSVRDALTRKN